MVTFVWQLSQVLCCALAQVSPTSERGLSFFPLRLLGLGSLFTSCTQIIIICCTHQTRAILGCHWQDYCSWSEFQVAHIYSSFLLRHHRLRFYKCYSAALTMGAMVLHGTKWMQWILFGSENGEFRSFYDRTRILSRWFDDVSNSKDEDKGINMPCPVEDSRSQFSTEHSYIVFRALCCSQAWWPPSSLKTPCTFKLEKSFHLHTSGLPMPQVHVLWRLQNGWFLFSFGPSITLHFEKSWAWTIPNFDKWFVYDVM